MYTLFVTSISPGANLAEATLSLSKALSEKGLSTKSIKLVGGAVSIEKTLSLLANGANDQLMEDLVSSFNQAADDAEVIIVEGVGSDVPESLLPFAPQLNADLIRNLQADVILINKNDSAEILNLSIQSLKIPASKVAAVLTDTADVASLDLDALKTKATAERETFFSPPAFRFQLIARARQANKRIVLPEGDEPRTIKAAIICQEKKIARCVLLAKPEDVERIAKAEGLTLPADLEILDPAASRDAYIAPLVEFRKEKGMTPELAAKELEDTVMQGTVMLALNEVDGLVSGAVHTTANTVRPALQIIKTAPGSNIVSSVFFMLMPDQVYVYGDCAINPNPTVEQLADIAIQSADSAQAFGITPRVALISYSTGTSGAGPDVEKIAQASALAQQQRPDLMIDGPLQYDAATVESVGRSKAPDSKVAGRASVFVFPDLNTGNCTYKAVQRSANVISVGPMLQGLAKPVNDLSRGALVDDIVFTIALTAIQAVQKA